jgi:hypothetical protein
METTGSILGYVRLSMFFSDLNVLSLDPTSGGGILKRYAQVPVFVLEIILMPRL